MYFTSHVQPRARSERQQNPTSLYCFSENKSLTKSRSRMRPVCLATEKKSPLPVQAASRSPFGIGSTPWPRPPLVLAEVKSSVLWRSQERSGYHRFCSFVYFFSFNIVKMKKKNMERWDIEGRQIEPRSAFLFFFFCYHNAITLVNALSV